MGCSGSRPAPETEAPARSQMSFRGGHDTVLVRRRRKAIGDRRNRSYPHSAVVGALVQLNTKPDGAPPSRRLRNPSSGGIGGLRGLRFPSLVGIYLPSQTTPTAMVSTVSGAPTLRYSQKPIGASWRARWITIRFATEPRMVKLPASVVAMASVSHDRVGSL